MNADPDESVVEWNLEVTSETVDQVEEILRDFATDAELDLALLVDNSGGMISGVAARPEVKVETVGALVAGAFGAMNALARELGETALTESLHHGFGDTIFLREIGDRFVLLGVSPAALPAGLVREKGAQIALKLGRLFDPAASDETEAEAETEPEAGAEESPFQAADFEEESPAEPAGEGVFEEETPSDQEAPAPASDAEAVPMPAFDPSLPAAVPAVGEGAAAPESESNPENEAEADTDTEAEADAGSSPVEDPAPAAKGPRYVFEIG